MEISQKLREQILEKAKDGFLKTLEFILEEPEIKKVFPTFKREKYEMSNLTVDVLAKFSFLMDYHGSTDIFIREFREDVLVFRDILKDVFPGYEFVEKYLGDSFDEYGNIKPRHEKFDLDFGRYKKDIESSIIGFYFIQEIKRQEILVKLSKDQMQEMQLDALVKKELVFNQVFELVFKHRGKIEFTLPNHLPYPVV